MKRRNLNFLMIALGFMFIFTGIAHSQVKNDTTPLKGKWDFKPQKILEIDSAGDDFLVNIFNLEVDNDGRIFVMDSKYSKFFVFSPEGKFLYSFGKKGEGPGEYKFVMDFYLQGKYVIVSDSSSLHYFYKDGRFFKSVRLPSNFSIRDFVDENRFVLVKSSEDEKSETEMLEIFDIRDDSRKDLAKFVAEKAMSASGGGMIVKLKDTETTPMVILKIKDSAIYFGKNDKYEITKTDLTGKKILEFSVKGKEGRAIPESFKRKRFENVKLNGAKMPEDMIQQMIKGMPDFCTLVTRLHIGANGMIYSYISDIANRNSMTWDIFSPDGKYQYQAVFTLPEGCKNVLSPRIKGNYLYTFIEDEEGERQLIKYKIQIPEV